MITHLLNVNKRHKGALIYHINATFLLVSFASLGPNNKCARAFFFQCKFLTVADDFSKDDCFGLLPKVSIAI